MPEFLFIANYLPRLENPNPPKTSTTTTMMSIISQIFI